MKSILLVEDQYIIAKNCSRFLKNKGFFVSMAKTCIEALNKLSKNDYDLILADCTLCCYSKKNILEEIAERGRDCGIIVTSGYFTEDEVRECIEKGAFCCMEKPFTIKELDFHIKCFFSHTC